MAIRIGVTEVKQIMDTSLSDPDILVHINIANRMVDKNLLSSNYTDDELADMERYWTAHLIAIGRERQASDETISGVGQVKYQGEFGKSLESTTYGQMLLALDTEGVLDKVSKKKARLTAIRQIDPDNPYQSIYP